MRALVVALIILVSVILETTLFPFLKLSGVAPDIMTTFIVSFGLLGGNPIAPIVGLIGGLVYDIVMGSILGVYALQYMLIGFMIGTLADKFFVGDIIIPVFFTVLSIFLKEAIMLLYAFFMRLEVSAYSILIKVAIPKAIYTAILMPFIYNFMQWLYKYKFMTKRWYFRES